MTKNKFFDKVPLSAPQSLGEEVANSITHGTGVGLSIAALVILVVFAAQRSDTWKVVSFSIYGATMIILFLASTLYHSFTQTKVKQFFRILDHSSIYLLIAGTYTPVTIGTMRGGWGWTLFGLIWGLAILGINIEIFAMHKSKIIRIVNYILMGWLIVIAIKPLSAVASHSFMIWILIGGLCYMFGAIFYGWKKLPYHHPIWHLFVLGGSICHFFGMLELMP
jgi:hemolysin III